jgi:BlaI family penicillinase repressor
MVATEQHLSRRERQLMDALFQAGEAAAADVRCRMPDAPSCTAVRTMLRILEDKGLVAHRLEGKKYIYRPLASPRREGRSALARVVRVFFGGSVTQALAAHFSDPATRLDDEELHRLSALIEEAHGADRAANPRKGPR